MPAGVAGEGWTPGWQRDPETEELLDGQVLEPEVDQLADDASEAACGEAVEGEAGLEDDDSRPTEEMHITPLLAESLQPIPEEEKTQPRIRVEGTASEHVDEAEADVRTNPKIKLADLGEPASIWDEDLLGPSVIIAPARVISDSPPVLFESTPAVVITEPSASDAAPALEVPSEPSQPLEPELEDAGLQLVDVEEAEPDAEQRRSRVPPPPPPPSVAARAELAPPGGPRSEATSLPAPQPASARAKPPPPAAPRGEPQVKRPPPPPTTAKLDEDRQKRKQVRQWWERFFSDDYLMTVLPPSAAHIARQVDFVEASLGLSKGATILDVGCGLGLHAIELTKRGYLVVGLDLSLAMITRAAEAAQDQSLKINFIHADIREMEFDGAFDGVFCMGTTFGFFDEEANRDVLSRLLHAMRPGGRMLLDVVNRDYVVGLQPNLVWFEGDDCVCMEESDFNYFNSRLSVKRTMMREDGRQSNAEYSLRLYSLHELGQLMQQLGLRVIEVSGQEAIRGAFFGAHSPRILMLAERRAQNRPSAAMPPERGSADLNRGSLPFPPERGSAEVAKPPKPE